MTTCRDIVTRSHEELAVIGSNRQLKARDATMGMELLSGIVTGVFGSAVGGGLSDLAIVAADEVAVDTRAVVSGHSAAFTITLPEFPRDGSRFQLVDAGAGFAARPITIARNGTLLEGATANLTANTDGFNRTWFYRADLADWKRITALTLASTFPFPEEFEDCFVVRLALRLSPRFRAQLSDATIAEVDRSMRQLRARYRTRKVVAADLAVLNLSEQAYSRGLADLT